MADPWDLGGARRPARTTVTADPVGDYRLLGAGARIKTIGQRLFETKGSLRPPRLDLGGG